MDNSIIEKKKGSVTCKCDTCGRDDDLPLDGSHDKDWRFKDGDKTFCSFDCEMEYQRERAMIAEEAEVSRMDFENAIRDVMTGKAVA